MMLLAGVLAFGQGRVVLVDIDGLRRDTLEHAYLEGRLPNLARILGEVHDGQGFGASLWFENATAVFPAITMAGQASLVTGVLPSVHGIPGNQWFDRPAGRVIDYFSAAGTPCVYGVVLISVECSGGLANRHLQSPTIYEAAAAAGKTSTVVFSQYWKGATHVVLPTVAEATALVRGTTLDFRQFDTTMMDRALESLHRDGLPDLLTLYFAGADGIGHLRGSRAQADYLANTIDPQMGRFLDRLGELDTQWRSGTQFIVTSDHGRTDAPAFPEDQGIESGMRKTLESAGFKTDQYQIVENGGVVHVYLSASPRAGERHCAGGVVPCVLGSRSAEPRWNGTPGTDDVLSAAKALSGDAGLKAVVDSVAFRSHVPGPGYLVYGADASKASQTVALLAAIDSPRSGDVLLLLKPGHYFGNTEAQGAQHGSGFAPDLAVPIAIALGGAHPGRSPAPLSTTDIPKIIAAYLGFTLEPQSRR